MRLDSLLRVLDGKVLFAFVTVVVMRHLFVLVCYLHSAIYITISYDYHMPENKHHGMVREMLHDMQHKFAMTQAEIAEFCGVSQPAISVMANGGGARDSTYRKLVELYNREIPKYERRIRSAAAALDDISSPQ